MRTLAISALSFSAAIFLSQYILGAKLNLVMALVFIAVGIAALLIKKYRKVGNFIALAGVFAATGFLYAGFYEYIFFSPAEKLSGTTREITAQVLDYPEEKDYGYKVEIKVANEGKVPVKALLFVFENKDKELRPGDNITLSARFALANELYGDKTDTFFSKGIFLFAYCTSDEIMVTQNNGTNIWFLTCIIRHALGKSIDNCILKSAIPAMKALLIGDRSELYEDKLLTESLQMSGIYHVMAVSGLHVSLLAGMMMIFCGKRRRMAAAITIPVIFLYVLITGNQPSAQRAAVMQLFILAAPLVYRESDSITSLSAALAVILAFNPFASKSAGLQLSFASVLGMVLLSERIYNYSSEKIEKIIKNKSRKAAAIRKICKGAMASFSASAGAMIFTVPLCAVYFGYVSLVAPVSSLLTAWLMPAAFCLGLIASVIGALGAPFVYGAYALGVGASAVINLMIYITSFIAKFQFAAVFTSNTYVVMWLVLLYMLIIMSIAFKATLRGVITAAAAVTAAFCAVMLISNFASFSGRIECTALDVGQGQCIVIQGQGHTVMVDCGSSNEDAGSIAAKFIKDDGSTAIDLLVMTHFDSDHINGFETLAGIVNISAVAIPDGSISDTDAPFWVERIAKENKIQVLNVTTDISVSFGKVNMTLFSMQKDEESDENDSGLIVLATNENFDILITGDAGSQTECDLIKTRNLPDTEVIVVGHHGSRYSTCTEYLSAVTPEIAIISVGYNSYGHPSEEVLKRLREKNITVLRTDNMGAVSVGS